MLFISLTSIGQVNNLSPCVDFSNKIDEIKEYNKNFEQILQNNFKDDYTVRFIAKPSFEPEYAFQINKEKDSLFEITTITWNTNLWYSKKVDSLFKQKRSIDNKLVSAVDTLFKLLIDSTIEKDAFGFGEDGITYIFTYNHKGCIKCGETWEPQKNSMLGEVIQICDDLVFYTQGGGVELDDLQYRINLIYERIK